MYLYSTKYASFFQCLSPPLSQFHDFILLELGNILGDELVLGFFTVFHRIFPFREFLCVEIIGNSKVQVQVTMARAVGLAIQAGLISIESVKRVWYTTSLRLDNAGRFSSITAFNREQYLTDFEEGDRSAAYFSIPPDVQHPLRYRQLLEWFILSISLVPRPCKRKDNSC